MTSMDVVELRRRNEARCQRILDRSELLDVDDLDWERVGDVEIAPDVVRTLIYMRDVEGYTDRDPVGLSAHRTTLADEMVAEFLQMWRVEEAGHTRALVRYLDRYAARTGEAIPQRATPPPSVAAPIEKVLGAIGGVVGRTVAAAHMTWGAANEMLTVNGYRLLSTRCGDPVLAEMLARIASQEARHFSFYVLQAEWRLAESGLARIALRKMLERAWTPVGVGEGYKPPADFAFVMGYLSSGADGERSLARMDDRMSRLPGLEGLRIYRESVPTNVAA
jgi:rubrerythrin